MSLNKIGYQIHAKTAKFARLVDRTYEFMCWLLEKHPKAYCSYSTGKDSLVMLDFCQKIKPGMSVMFHDSGVELPESNCVLRKAEKHYGLCMDIVKSPVDVLEVYSEKKAFVKGGSGDFAWTIAMLNPILEWSRSQNKELALIGLRKQESKNRRLLIHSRGPYFFAKTRNVYQAFPLNAWTARDVFAYIYANGLEDLLHPAYLKTRFVDMEKIRVSWYCDPVMVNRGGFVWLRFYYPNIFRVLIDRFPEIGGCV